MTESKDRETVPERWNAAGPGSDMWMDAAQDPRFAAGTKLEGERPGWRADPGSAKVVLGFLLPDRQAVDDRYAELTSAGYRGRQPPFDAFWILVVN